MWEREWTVIYEAVLLQTESVGALPPVGEEACFSRMCLPSKINAAASPVALFHSSSAQGVPNIWWDVRTASSYLLKSMKTWKNGEKVRKAFLLFLCMKRESHEETSRKWKVKFGSEAEEKCVKRDINLSNPDFVIDRRKAITSAVWVQHSEVELNIALPSSYSI